MEDVLIVGAGPAGLVTAIELATAGVPCRIVERRGARSGWSRAFGIHARTLEQFESRGLAAPLVERGYRSPEIRLDTRLVDLNQLRTTFPYLLIIPQNETEEVLESAVRALGVPIERPAEVVGVQQDEHGVEVRIKDESGRVRTERARYVVAADGHHSTVRKLLEQPFPGSQYSMTVMLGDVLLLDPIGPQMQILSTRRGMVLTTPFRDGYHRVITIDHRHTSVPVDEPLTIEQLASSTRHVIRRTLGFVEARWLSRFSSQQRLVENYRVGRVFLVGDAAHVHSPAGGQGLNTGVQDAFNLGWKLAAAAQGWAPDWLLDSYHEERHPIGADVIKRTDMMLKAMSMRARPARAVRKLAMSTVLAIPPAHRRIAASMAMTSLAYPAAEPGAHALTGTSVQAASLVLPDGTHQAVHDLLRNGQYLLVVDNSAGAADDSRAVLGGWSSRIRRVEVSGVAGIGGGASGGAPWPGAVLIRPDGYVAAAAERADAGALMPMLRRWCGEPVAPATPERPASPRPAADLGLAEQSERNLTTGW